MVEYYGRLFIHESLIQAFVYFIGSFLRPAIHYGRPWGYSFDAKSFRFSILIFHCENPFSFSESLKLRCNFHSGLVTL